MSVHVDFRTFAGDLWEVWCQRHHRWAFVLRRRDDRIVCAACKADIGHRFHNPKQIAA